MTEKQQTDPEKEFVDQYEHAMARRVARDLYRAMHPKGMHTNGPTMVLVEASRLSYLLTAWRKK